MFVEAVAIEAVPSYARVPEETISAVRQALLAGPAELQVALDAAFRALEERQPAVALFIANELAGIEEPGAQGVAYFLSALVGRAFDEAFGARLARIELADLDLAVDRLIADGELRGAGSGGRFYSEDAVALGQPALVKLVRTELDRAIEDVPDAETGKALDAFYQGLLVLIIALTRGVAPDQRSRATTQAHSS